MEASDAPRKHRSPAYPALDLAKALQRAQRLWDIAGKHPAPLSSAMKAWGYSPKSSGGLQTVAALKQYGLANDDGTGWERRISLTKAAQELFVYGADKDSPEWKNRAREAALRPKVYKGLWAKYQGSLPDDSVILPYLILDRQFSEEAARVLLKRFRDTIAFAGVTAEGGTVSENGEDSDNPDDPDGEPNAGEQIVKPATIEKPPKPDLTKEFKAKAPRTIQVTYSPTEWALVQGQFPMSQADWDTFLAVLQSMKPGLVTPDESSD